MKTNRILAICGVVVVGLWTSAVVADAARPDDSILKQAFDFSPERSGDVQHYEMESRLITYALDGRRTGTDIYRLHLTCRPGRVPGKDPAQYTCTKFTVQLADAAEVAVPVLKDWTYPYTGPMDSSGQVCGIDHAKFAGLKDAHGNLIPIGNAYHVYNAFIDFHGICDIYARPIDGGKSIRDLKRIGQRIVHAAAFTEPPVNLGDAIAKGSTFKNGEVTLELKGLSLVDGAACALVGYDSGNSSFQMLTTPAPNMKIRSVGSSHYQGDIHVDLETLWVRKATLTELVVTETTLPMPPNKINAVIERAITIRNVGADGR